jgi:hypothetical protein
MRWVVTDEDIQSFLARNASKHDSQIALIQSALQFLWPEGAPHEAIDRVVVAALARPATVGPSRRASQPSAGAALPGL